MNSCELQGLSIILSFALKFQLSQNNRSITSGKSLLQKYNKQFKNQFSQLMSYFQISLRSICCFFMKLIIIFSKRDIFWIIKFTSICQQTQACYYWYFLFMKPPSFSLRKVQKVATLYFYFFYSAFRSYLLSISSFQFSPSSQSSSSGFFFLRFQYIYFSQMYELYLLQMIWKTEIKLANSPPTQDKKSVNVSSVLQMTNASVPRLKIIDTKVPYLDIIPDIVFLLSFSLVNAPYYLSIFPKGMMLLSVVTSYLENGISTLD